jgi:hypothetical protein
MFHYKIAILHAKSFILQSPVTPINTVYIQCLTESSYVIKIPFTKCPNVSFSASKSILLSFQFTKFQNL